MRLYRTDRKNQTGRSARQKFPVVASTGKKLVCPTVRFFLFVLPGTGLWAAGVFAIVGPFATEAEFWQSLGQIYDFWLCGE